MNRTSTTSHQGAILDVLAIALARDAKAASAPPLDPVLVLAGLYRNVRPPGTG